jgi:hypothetical protein
MNGNAVVAKAVAELLSMAPQMATILALGMAVPVSLGVLAFYRRRILRSMTTRAPSALSTVPNQDPASSASGRPTRPPIAWHRVNRAAIEHRAGLARVYILGGVGLAAALAVVDALVNAGDEPFSALRFFLTAICFSTPLALSVRLVYGRWKPSFAIVGWQVVAVVVLGTFSPWRENEAYPIAIVVSLMLALLLHPRIRAMGVLATGFFTVVFTGAIMSMAASIFLLRDYIQTNILANPQTRQVFELWSQAVGTGDERQAQLFDAAASSLMREHGMFVLQTMAVLILVGAVVSAIVGSLLFVLVTRSYARKRFGEQWLVIASVWLILSVAVASVLSPVGLPANLACVAVFGVGVAVAGRRLPQDQGRDVRLLLLRSFTLGQRSDRLFQDLESSWRSIGSIQLVGAVDVAVTTLEPHELLGFLRGRTGREFVHRPTDVDARLASFDHERDPDGRFRVNVIFCGGDATWKYAVNRMLLDSDCVLMDLRGFSRHRAGCVFEIRCLAESDLPFRTVFLVDESTDRGFISETWDTGAKGPRMRAKGDAYRLVSEQPFDMSVSERIMSAFSNADGVTDVGVCR